MRVVCSKGTYIRALARDIGQALGSGAHLTTLRRDRVGDYPLDGCLSVDDAVNLIRTTPMQAVIAPDTPAVEIPPLAPETADRTYSQRADILPWHLRPRD